MVRHFCNITGAEISPTAVQLDLEPSILRLLTPLSVNIHPLLSLITGGNPFEVVGISLDNTANHGINLTIKLKCIYFKGRDEQDVMDEIDSFKADCYLNGFYNDGELVVITIPMAASKELA